MGYTVSSTPPNRKRPRMWEAVLEECRAFPGAWRRVNHPMTQAYAAQVASDLRNAHRKPETMKRHKYILPTDVWEAVSGPYDPAGTPDKHFLWLKYAGPNGKAKQNRA